MRVKYLPVAEGRRLHIEAFPNFSASGSIKGMKDKFYGKNALLVKCGSYIYNVGNSEHGRTIYNKISYTNSLEVATQKEAKNSTSK